MPNTGRPSRDCHECRQRRIKCDLVRPGCGQCIRKGLRCSGYRDETSSLFQIETVSSYQSNHNKGPRRKRNTAGNPYPLLKVCRSRSETVNTEGRTVSIPWCKPLSEPWEDHVMPLAKNNFDFSSTFSDLLKLAEEDSALYKAAYAFGCAYLENISQSHTATSYRVKAYGTAIASMNLALHDPRQYQNDSILLGVLFLGLYELLLSTQDSANGFSKWDIHNQGLIELIRQRGRDQFRRQDGRNLFFTVYNTMHNRVLTPDPRYFDEAIMWFNEIHKYCEAAEYPVLRAYIFTYHCTRICTDIQELLNTGDPDTLLLNSETILQDAENVENILYPLTHDSPVAKFTIDPPLAPRDSYIGTSVLRSNYRLRLSHHVLEFVKQASEAPSCTSQQRVLFSAIQNRCLDEIRVLRKKISRFLGLISHHRLRAFATMGSSIFLHKPNVMQRTQTNSKGTIVSAERQSRINIPLC